MRNWLLPEKFEDILPPQAQRIDRMRAKLLELFRVHGFQLVIPPMLEYLESLLTGTGHDLDLRTFKLVDQLSGRMMGLRADITPQVARIDAHLLNRAGVTRLCYCGSALHTLPPAAAAGAPPRRGGRARADRARRRALRRRRGRGRRRDPAAAVPGARAGWRAQPAHRHRPRVGVPRDRPRRAARRRARGAAF